MSDPYVGKTVAERFKITSRIGEGGMGLVYFAEDLATKSQAAVKFLHRHLISNEEFVARFRQEAKTASQFRHENAVRVLDSGEDEDGTPFIAMDFCPGRSLRALIDEAAPFAVDRACRIAEKILRALAQAHKHGIIHRDLKPDNIKVESDGSENEVVKVLDFGVAKFIGSEDMQEMSGAVKTATGVVFGTPKYMAPEQIRGEGVDSGSDIYAVGAILYEMLSGHPTFDADDMMEFVTKYLNQPVPDIGIRAGDIDIPVAVRKLTMQMLDKDREKRPGNASEIANRPAASSGDSMRTANTSRAGWQTVRTWTGWPSISKRLLNSPAHRSRVWRGFSKSPISAGAPSTRVRCSPICPRCRRCGLARSQDAAGE